MNGLGCCLRRQKVVNERDGTGGKEMNRKERQAIAAEYIYGEINIERQ